EQATAFCVQAGSVLLVEDGGETLHGAKGSAHVVGNRIGKGFEFADGFGKPGGALRHELFQGVLDLLALSDVGQHDDDVRIGERCYARFVNNFVVAFFAGFRVAGKVEFVADALAGKGGIKAGFYLIVKVSQNIRDTLTNDVGIGQSENVGVGLVGEKIAALFVHHHQADLSFVGNGAQHRFALAQGFFKLLAFGDIPSGASDCLNFTVPAKDRDKDVIVNPPPVCAGEGDFTADGLPGGDDLFNFPVMHGGVPGLVSEFEAVFADGFVPGPPPHFEQGCVRVGETVIQAKDINQVRRIR